MLYQEKQLFIKDMAYYLFAPDGRPSEVAPSLRQTKYAPEPASSLSNGTGAIAGKANPTVLPTEVLAKYHFTFLIRHPRRAIPSFWRCTVPPLSETTGYSPFSPSEAGYSELRRLFDFLKDNHLIGLGKTGEKTNNRGANEVTITVVDADDLLDDPERVIKAFCKDVGLKYSPDMLQWDDEESLNLAKELFGKWDGFHNDALESKSLKPRSHHAVSVPKSASRLC
jgi:hypothetical protein